MTGAHPRQRPRVICWQINLPDRIENATVKILDEAEQARAAAMPSPRQRMQYISAHVALRQILGAHVGAAPAELRFASEAYGRPVLEHAKAPHFSLSHSGRAAMIALCCEAKIGVDLEQRRPRPKARRLVERLFAAEEQAALLPLAETAFARAFGRLWVMKEAYIKADGRGLACPLNSFALDPFAPTVLRNTTGFPSWAQLSYKGVCNKYDSALVVCSTKTAEIEYRVFDMRGDLYKAA
ncbi:4'-phosphopantetheinyl transferase superfamily protein [Phaeobacter sp.]|uniref:4'-phosphopantetheinyl transferase family protein n=1 Tax=Phaeobacter sp. TaxID=1902409 RepID=UPI0025FA15ED|nr:4'-phosphopantetheinyl transferase superfamily protein [Phaeobacter sp.]